MATPAARRIPPTPAMDPVAQPFFEAAQAERLLIGLCRDTGRHFFYPRPSSPFTLSPNVEMVRAAGTGTIYSFTVARGKEPYALALVELTEGPRVLTNIVECDVDALAIGQAVRLLWQTTDDGHTKVAMFTPVAPT